MKTKKGLNYIWKYTISILIALITACILFYIMDIVYTAVYDTLLTAKEQVLKTFNDKFISVTLNFLLITFPYIVFCILTPICGFGTTYGEAKKYFKL